MIIESIIIRDIKLFAENKRKLEDLMLTVRIFSDDTGIEFG